MNGFSALVSTVVDVAYQDLADPLLGVPFGEVFLEPVYQVLVVIEKEVALAKHSGHLEAPWASVPRGGFPGFELTPGAEFSVPLPMLVVVTLVIAIETLSVSVGMVIQQASRRRTRATDVRLLQGALNTSGLGILLSGVAGTIPPVGYSASSVSLINLTGVAARSVGYAIGVILLGMALAARPRII